MNTPPTSTVPRVDPCTRSDPLANPATMNTTTIPAAGVLVTEAREDSSHRFISFIGPRAQHAPPFLGIPETNFYCLRSFVDRRTGETAHQLYVTDSYFGADRGWNAGPNHRDIAALFDQARERLKPDGKLYVMLSAHSELSLIEKLIGRAGLRFRVIRRYSIVVDAFVLYECTRP